MQRFTLNKSQGKLMGVAAGVADMTSADPLLIRLGFILAALVTGPVAIILYLAAGILAPQQ